MEIELDEEIVGEGFCGDLDVKTPQRVWALLQEYENNAANTQF